MSFKWSLSIESGFVRKVNIHFSGSNLLKYQKMQGIFGWIMIWKLWKWHKCHLMIGGFQLVMYSGYKLVAELTIFLCEITKEKMKSSSVVLILSVSNESVFESEFLNIWSVCIRLWFNRLNAIRLKASSERLYTTVVLKRFSLSFT